MLHPFVKEFRDELIKTGIADENNIIGCTDKEIEQMYKKQHVQQLPQMYVDLLRVMGKDAGSLYQGGTEFFYKAHMMFDIKAEAIELLQADKAPFKLP